MKETRNNQAAIQGNASIVADILTALLLISAILIAVSENPARRVKRKRPVIPS